MATEPLSSRKIAEVASLADGTEARTLIRQLNEFYDLQASAFRVEEVAGGFQLLTRSSFGGWLRRFHPLPAEMRLSPPALETLAVVAYRQPVMRAEIESIRGVQCGEILRQLIERDLVRMVGRSDELGRPFLYGTTKAFMRAFGLRSLAELPRAQQLGREQNTDPAPAGRENMPAGPPHEFTPSNDLKEEPEVTIAAISESAREDLWQVGAAQWAIERAHAKDDESEDLEDDDYEDDDADDDEDLDEDDDLDDDDIEDEEWEEVDDDDDWEDDDEDDDDWEDDDEDEDDDDWEDE